jgi:uncharacterized phage protein gp47/JayE
VIGSFGILSTGPGIKRTPDITDQLQTALQADFGAAFSLIPNTPEGQLMLRTAEQVADLWELGEQVYNSLYNQTASGVSLDRSESLTNNGRIPQTASVANGVVITGTPTTVVPANFQLSVAGNPGAVFQIVNGPVTIGGGGTVAASFACLTAGPVAAPEGSLTTIVNAVSGVASATNPSDAQLGTFAETDSAFRQRAALSRNAPATAGLFGIIKAVQATLNVSEVFGFENVTDSTDANGLLPHSFMIVVVGGADQDIANAIYASKGGGIASNGTTSVTVYDSNNTPHQISFNRLADVPIYMTVAVTKNTNPSVGPVYPANGATLVANAVLAYGATYIPGQTVTLAGFLAAAFIPGVLGLTINFATTPAPTGNTPIPMLPYQLATFSAANLAVS